MRVVCYLGSEYKGLFLSIAQVLIDQGHEVWMAARDQNVEALALRLVPRLRGRVLVCDTFKAPLRDEDVVAKALQYEKTYGETMAMLLSQDRGLGQGYLLNVNRHPHVHRALWPNTRKMRLILEWFLFYEHVLDTAQPEMVLGHDRPVPFHLVAAARLIPYYSLGVARIGDRLMWYETPHEEKVSLVNLVRELVTRLPRPGAEKITYEHYREYVTTARLLRFSYRQALYRSIDILTHETYARMRGIHKRDSYVFGGWIPSLFRKKRCYEYVRRFGVTPGCLAGNRLVYFPLHQEPEAALLDLSPEFNNSMEIISWVSKSMPADTILVVKENPWSFGVRSRSFYTRLRKIGNVALSNPDVPSWDWIKASAFTVVITGTAGWESVYFHRPVLSYGRHQLINHLPSVRYASSFFETRAAVQDLMNAPPSKEVLQQAAYALDTALKEKSFSLPGHEGVSASRELHIDLAQKAVERLRLDYPTYFRADHSPI